MLWVLLLNSGVYAKSAEGGRVGCCMLYRPAGTPKWWQSLILGGAWSAKAKDRHLTVRKGLVLVIPHPDHVKQFLEAPGFEIVQGLAEKGQHDAPGRMVQIPFLSRFYNFTSLWPGTDSRMLRKHSTKMCVI